VSTDGLQASVDKMRREGVGDAAVKAFADAYERLEGGETGVLPEDDIEPVDEVPDADELPDAVIDALSTALAALDPQAAIRVALRCPACDAGWDADFDIGAFLWSELDAWAQRTLCDVHELALRYGWSESEVLALTPARRARYLAIGAS